MPRISTKNVNTKVPKGKNPQYTAPKKKGEGKGSSSEEKRPDHAKLVNWLQYADAISKKKHWDYFVIDQFLKGNHTLKGDPSTNTISVSSTPESLNFPINKISSTFRAVRAFVTRHKPKVDVSPEESTDEARDYARRSNKILERDNQLNNSRRINKEWVYYGIKYGTGWRQVGYDKEKKCSIRWSIDPTDLLVGSKTGRPEDAPYMIKVLTRTVGYWRNKFDKANIVPDNEVAYDEYKKLASDLNFQHGDLSTQPEDEQTALGFECWYRVFDKNSMGGIINKCLFTLTEILDFEETPYDEYPFISYEAEISPNEVTPDGHLKNVIAPQRMLNLLNTQLLEYNHIVNRGRFLKDKDAGFSNIYAKEGQIIQRKAGKRVEVLPPPPINPALLNQITMSEGWIEDLGGQHDASMGVTPDRVTSGKAIEALQMGDSNNISDLRDNFEDALSKESTWILKLYSLFEEEGFVLEDEKKDGETDRFGVMGYEANGGKVPDKYLEDDGGYCAMCAILPDNKVKVSVVSELGETKEARFDLLLKMKDSEIITAKEVLNYTEFPNTTDVLQRMAEEALGQVMLDSLRAKMTQPPMDPGAMPPGGEVPPQAGIAPPPPPSEGEDLALLNQQAGDLLNG